MTWFDNRCGKTLSDRAQHCDGCHETFVGTAAGDAHRVGPHDGERRCLTVAEMLAHPKRTFRQDGRGYWHLGEPDPQWTARPTHDAPTEEATHG